MHSHFSLVSLAFDVFTKVCAPFVATSLRDHFGSKWWELGVISKLPPILKSRLPPSGEESKLSSYLDASRILNLIECYWTEVFRERLGQEARPWVLEAKANRNTWAHKGSTDFSAEDAWRTIDTISRIVSRIDDAHTSNLIKLREKIAIRKARQSGSQANAASLSRAEGASGLLPTNDIWVVVSSRLKPTQEIPNWTAAKGYLGDTFEVVGLTARSLQVSSPGAQQIQNVPAGDFQKIYPLWSSYVGGQTPRTAFTALSRFSKYIISILKFVEDEQNTK